MFLRSVFQRLAPASHTRAARRRRGVTASRHRRARQFEPLEDRRVLAVLYAANDSGFQITNDTAPPGLSAGDTVTWAGGGQFSAVPNLTFGTNAFDSINAAIAAASDGDTIEVASGNYSEQVDVTKSITLLGAEHGVDARGRRAGGGESVLDAADNAGKTQFIVGANDVVIDGFTIQKQTSRNAFGAAIEIQPGHHGTHVVNDIIQNNQVGLSLANDSYTDQAVVKFDLFQDNNQPGVSGGTAIYSDQTVAGGALDYVLIDSNKLVGNANYGIDISPTDPNNGAWNVTISNNTIDANGRGIYLSDVPLASVSGNDITNEVTPADGGESVAIGVEGNSGVTVMDNNLHGGVGNGIQVGSDSPADQSDATINNNSIYGFAGESVSVGSGYGASRPVNATENWWGTNDSATIAGELSGRVAFSPYLDNASNTIASGPGFQSYLTQIDVTQLSPQWGSVGPIAQGVNDTAPGGVLTVQAGTYTEADVSISSNITVQGIGNVVLQAPTAGSGTGILIVVSASGVTISNLSIENFAQGISSEGIPQQPILLSPPAVNPPASVIQPANIQLTDVTLRGNTTGADLYSLNQLSITTTTSDDQVVDISPPAAGLPADYPDTVQFASQDAIRFNSPAVVVSTGAGSDTFNVSPLQDATITINGGSPPPPATPGDTLNVDTGGTTGGNLSVSAFPGGLSGAWTFDNGKPVDFSGIETLSPLTLDGQGAESITATEGIATGNVVVATFTDSASGHLLSDYSADIDWGDGTTTTGAISYDASSHVYSVTGNHVYAEDPNPRIVGPDNRPRLLITVHRAGSPDLTLGSVATVAEPPLTGTGVTLSGNENSPLTDAMVATFTHGDGAEAAADFTANIDWGDGTSSAGTVSLAGGTYSVAGSHTYKDVGSFAVTVTVNDDSRRTTINSAADIGPELPSQVTASGAGQTITATEGVSTGDQVVATFTDTAGLPLTDYSADIDWGDGTSSTGSISLDASSGVYSVSGSHTYAEDGSEQIAVIVHRTSAPDATLDATATVVEPPLVQLFPPVVAPLGHEGTAITVDVGYFTHGNNTEPTGGFTATIDWGDGTTSAGQVAGGNGSSYVVNGTHTYHDEGHYTVKATVLDTSGDNTLALSTVVAIREALLPDGTEGTADERFVSEVYNDLLHRPVDANGLAYWSGKLTDGASRAEVVAGIENTDEYRHAVVASLYETYLVRAVDPVALENGEALLAHGGTREQLASIIAGSDEYFHAHGGTNDGFLRALFLAALNRPIDAAAQTHAEQELANGATRAQVAEQIFGSHEYHVDVVQDLYLVALNRSAEAGGATYFTNQLDHGATDEQVLAALMSSDEYFGRVA